jgi:predicted transcriptional regulator
MTATISIPIDSVTRERLAERSRHRDCTQTEVAEQALREYLDLQIRQVKAIDEGIRAADQGRLIDHHDLRSRWESKLGNQVD